MRYLVLGAARSGTTLLLDAIATATGRLHALEPFNPVLPGEDPASRWRQAALDQLYGAQTSYCDAAGYLDGARFDLGLLAGAVFRDFAGAKILWDQVCPGSTVWDVLDAIPDLHVLVLRRNPVASGLSFQSAMTGGVWHAPADEPVPAPVEGLSFPPGWFAWFHDWFCAPEAAIRARLAGRPQLDIAYDTLIADWAGEMARVLRFLGVDAPVPPMAWRKLATKPARSRIPDFDAVAASYAGHPALAAAFADLAAGDRA